jgi:hypothetical protein
VAEVLRAAPGNFAQSEDGDASQLTTPDGRLFTVFGSIPPGTEWEYDTGPYVPAGMAVIPDMTRVTVCFIECRWEDLFVDLVRKVAVRLGAPTWVLDSNRVLWVASEVDASDVAL